MKIKLKIYSCKLIRTIRIFFLNKNLICQFIFLNLLFKIHKFEDFILHANLPFDKNNFEIDSSSIILRGVKDDLDINYLTLYVENLIDDDVDLNDVSQIERSKFLNDIVYVKFERSYVEEKIKLRIERRPIIKNR